MALMCGEYHLPRAGGIEEQSYGLLKRMNYLRFVYRAVSKLPTLVGNELNTGLSNDERILLGHLREEGLF